jgi:hypothetical protein
VNEPNPYRSPNELPRKRSTLQVALALFLGLIGVFYAFIGWAAIIVFTYSYLSWTLRKSNPNELRSFGIEAFLFVAAFGGTCLVFAAAAAYRGAGRIAVAAVVVGIAVLVTGHLMPSYLFETPMR